MYNVAWHSGLSCAQDSYYSFKLITNRTEYISIEKYKQNNAKFLLNFIQFLSINIPHD